MSLEPASRTVRVLFIDDEELICEVAQEMLASLRYQSICYSDPNAALDHYRNAWDRYDLVILDQRLTVTTGLDCFLQMRLINPEVRALLTSGMCANELDEAMAAGMCGCLPKPFSLAELDRVIREAVA